MQGLLFSTFLLTFAFRAIRQVRAIVEIHRRATEIKLYDVATNSAFSRLTLRTSVAVTVPFAIAEVVAATAAGISNFEIVLIVSLILLSVALFVLPLVGMHGRLLDLKETATVESNRTFETVARDLHRLVDTADYAHVEGTDKAIAALAVEADRLKKLSTWPWRAETLSRFLSSIALPVLLWAITTLLGRFVV